MGLISSGLPIARPQLGDLFNQRAAAVPLVSVITIFFNAERFIREAIDSVLAQDFTSFELILVDDGSEDGGSALAREYAAKFPEKIFYLEHEGHSNKGMSASRNVGIRCARGTYITFCDADDVWIPNKLSEQLKIFRSHPELGMVCGAANYWSSWMGGKDRVGLSGHVQNTSLRPPSACLSVYPLGWAAAPCNDVLVHRDVVLNVDGFEDQFTGMYEDQAFLVKVYLSSPVFFSSQVTLKYRQHAESCSAVAEHAGHYDSARRQFLEWFAEYVRALPPPRPLRVEAAIQRALMAYRRPWLYFFVALPGRAASRVRRKIRAVKSFLIYPRLQGSN
jgi:glycosyltransferase involved in cell wall biosynthesis